jgi:hypothetical protein
MGNLFRPFIRQFISYTMVYTIMRLQINCSCHKLNPILLSIQLFSQIILPENLISQCYKESCVSKVYDLYVRTVPYIWYFYFFRLHDNYNNFSCTVAEPIFSSLLKLCIFSCPRTTQDVPYDRYGTIWYGTIRTVRCLSSLNFSKIKMCFCSAPLYKIK